MKTMMRMKIGNEAVFNLQDKGFHLIKSPERYANDIKDSNIVVIDFPEEDGARVYMPKEVKVKALDYTIKLAYCNDAGDAPKKISALIQSMIGKDITIYNDYKKVQLKGKYKSYKDEGTYEGTKVVIFEITFLIPNPKDIIYL